jgi:pimeloyl-ACP methyl ester carboxylesterase
MKRFLLSFAMGLSGLGIFLAISAARAMPVRISVGDHSVRTFVTGKGSPSVVLETSGVAYLEAWNRIQSEIGEFAKVFSYDHAGYWGSEPGPKPRDATQIARELHTALRKAKVSPPYILVGYSFGGPYIRVFAGLYPNEVAGMVFVDPSQEEFMAWLNRHFPNLNVVTEEDRQKQDEWGSQWSSMNQARDARLPNVPITLISAARSGGPLLRRLLPEWLGAHRKWLNQFPHAHHIVSTNSGHGTFFVEPQLVVTAVKAMVAEAK